MPGRFGSPSYGAGRALRCPPIPYALRPHASGCGAHWRGPSPANDPRRPPRSFALASGRALGAGTPAPSPTAPPSLRPTPLPPPGHHVCCPGGFMGYGWRKPTGSRPGYARQGLRPLAGIPRPLALRAASGYGAGGMHARGRGPCQAYPPPLRDVSPCPSIAESYGAGRALRCPPIPYARRSRTSAAGLIRT